MIAGLVAASLLGGASHAHAGETVPFDEVAATLAEQTGGAIAPNPQVPHPDGFRVEDRSPGRLLTVPERPDWQDFDLFTFDVLRWLEHTGAPNFLQSKRDFYEQRDFDPRLQQHDRPYPYLSSWMELFHPPMEDVDLPLSVYSDFFGPPRPDTSDAPWFDPAWQRALDEDSQTELTRDNALTLLDSDEAYHEKLRMVREATESMYVSVMFFGCDETSDALADAMMERAAAGVDVRLLTEGVYRATLSRRCTDRMILGGVKVATVQAWNKPRTAQAVLHYKVWIRDGEEVIQGGANILDFENEGTGINGLDRDTDLHVTGPMVTDAEEAYLLAWERWAEHDAVVASDTDRMAELAADKQAQRDAGDRGPAHYADWLVDPDQRTTGLCRMALQNLGAERHAIAPMVEAYLAAARHQVVFVSPAMKDEQLDTTTRIGRLMALIEERTGPDDPKLVVLSNGRGGGAGELGIWLRRNAWFVRQRGNRFWPPLLRQYQALASIRASIRNRGGAIALQERNPNAEVWMYSQHLHTKTWLFDRQVTVVGSWNLDMNSADLNYENAVVCLDDGLRDAIERDFTRALVNAIPVTSANGQ